MQSPSQEIQAVIEQIYSSPTPDIQKSAITKFFTSDAALRTPWYSVKSGVLSREDILGVYQWYRTVSPVLDVHVVDSVYDRLHNIVYADVTVLYHLRFTPWAPAPCRTMTRFTLRQELGLHYIALQEDFLHPDDAASVYMPYLGPLVRAFLSAGSLSANVWARCAQVFGIWRAPPGVDHVHIEDDIAAFPPQPRPGEGKMKNKVKREMNRAIKRAKRQDQEEMDVFGTVVEPEYVKPAPPFSNLNTTPVGISSSSRFGGPVSGSRFNTVHESNSSGKLFSHVLSGKGPFDS